MPAEPNTLACLEGLYFTANSRNSPDNFMTRNKRIMADTPIVRNKVKIAVANAAVRNCDLNLLRAYLAWLVVEGQEFRPRGMCCKSLNLWHGLSEFLVGGEIAGFISPRRRSTSESERISPTLV